MSKSAGKFKWYLESNFLSFYSTLPHCFRVFFPRFGKFFPHFCDKMGKNFPRFSQKLGENGKKFPPFLKKQGENGKKFPQGKIFPFSPNFFINANTLILKADSQSTALPDNLRTFKTILIDFDLFDNFYLSRQNQRLSRLKYCKGTS